MKNRYKAFISYSHADEAWARWLQAANRSDPQILDPGRTDAVAGTLADLRHDRGVIE